MKENVEVRKAKKVLEEISKDENERYLAELREKYIMDQKAIEDAGYDKGLRDGKVIIAKNMLKQNIEIELISKITGISVKEIENLKD